VEQKKTRPLSVTEIEQLRQQNADLQMQVELLTEQIRLMRVALFAPKSETKLAPANPDQPTLFNEAEVEAEPTQVEPELQQVAYTRRKRQGKREADLVGLPVEQIVHELPESKQLCPQCQSLMHACGHEVARRELTYVPATMHVTEHVHTVYSCRNCEVNHHRTPMLKAPVPAPVVKGSGVASPSLLAYVAHQKYVMGVPLHRQEQEFTRNDIHLSRQTMANWIIYAAQSWLTPLYLALCEQLLSREVLHADETTVQVLKEAGKTPQSKSYMWLYRTSGDTDHPIVIYDYQKDRKHERPKQFLAGFTGYLHADGYGAYHQLPEDIIPVGCWAHARRKLAELAKSIPEQNQADSIAAQGLKYCDTLFAIERDIADLPPTERYQQRLLRSKPVMEELFAWATRASLNAIPRSATDRALAYALGQRRYLQNVLLDGRLELSNNRGERSIKPFVIGRKNWLFSTSPQGADASAMFYSIIETAKENGLNPRAYLEHIFHTAPNTDLTNPKALEALLPWNAPENCRKPQNIPCALAA